MPIAPNMFVHQTEIAAAVELAEQELAPDVVRIRFNLGEDWSGDPAVFFRVVLSDDASRMGRLREMGRRVQRVLAERARPEELGLLAYFNYRNVSEQAEMKEPSWE